MDPDAEKVKHKALGGHWSTSMCNDDPEGFSMVLEMRSKLQAELRKLKSRDACAEQIHEMTTHYEKLVDLRMKEMMEARAGLHSNPSVSGASGSPSTGMVMVTAVGLEDMLHRAVHAAQSQQPKGSFFDVNPNLKHPLQL